MNLQKDRLLSEFNFKTSRSSGKGGQHVNKTESRVSLFFDVAKSEVLEPEQKDSLLKSNKLTLSSEGVLQLDVEESRSQLKNKKIAIERFFEKITEALKKPKKRKATKPSKAAIRKRIKKNKQHSEKKQNRRKDF